MNPRSYALKEFHFQARVSGRSNRNCIYFWSCAVWSAPDRPSAGITETKTLEVLWRVWHVGGEAC